MEKISWTDHVRIEEVLLRVNEQRNILHGIRKRKANWISHILRRNCLLKQVIEGKIKGEMEVTRRRGRRRKKLLDDLKDRRGYSHMKEEALDRTMWRNRFRGGFGPVVRPNTEWMRHIWIKPGLCSRMVSLFHHTSPWIHRCLQASPNAHRNGRVFRCLVQTACCYWILNRGKSSSNWNSQTNASRLWWSVCWCEYGKTLRKVKSAVRKWLQKQNTIFFKDGFQKPVQRWWNCIEVRGDFVEK